jgi:diguanylate cyclase (GGDEF)-like protein
MAKNKKAVRKMAATVRVAQVGDHRLGEAIGNQTASLLVVQGAEVDLGRHILLDRPITMGRDERVDLPLNDGSISRAHCRVERDPENGRYVLVDLGSTNGTSLNGVRVRDHVPLTAGDKIFLGASVIRFSFSDAFDVEFHSRLEEMVSTDPLTGLSSKRQYDAIYDALLERALAEESPLGVLVMDMDGLKQINDTHGHEMGSYAIAEVGRLIREELAGHGHVCRFGGDEFTACIPGLDGAGLRAIAETLRARVGGHAFVKGGIAIKPTLSIGVASYPDEEKDAGQLFTSADHAMYRAKRAGKNRVG